MDGQLNTFIGRSVFTHADPDDGGSPRDMPGLWKLPWQDLCSPVQTVSLPGVRRSDFLKLSLLPLPAFLFGLPPSSPFQRWLHCFSAKAVSCASSRSVEVSIPPARLAEAMHALNSITDGPMRCEGRTVRTRVDGTDLLLRLV